MEPPIADNLALDNALPLLTVQSDFLNSNVIIEDAYPFEDEPKEPETSADEDARSLLLREPPSSPPVPTKRDRIFNTFITPMLNAFTPKNNQWLFKRNNASAVPNHSPMFKAPPAAIKKPRHLRSYRQGLKDKERFYQRSDAFSINSNESLIHRETASQEKEEQKMILGEFYAKVSQTQGEADVGSHENFLSRSMKFSTNNPFHQQINSMSRYGRSSRPRKSQFDEEPSPESLRLQQHYLRLYPDTIPVDKPRLPLSFPKHSCVPRELCPRNTLGVGTSENLVKSIQERREREKRLEEQTVKPLRSGLLNIKKTLSNTLSSTPTADDATETSSPEIIKSLFSIKRWAVKSTEEKVSEVNDIEQDEKDTTSLQTDTETPVSTSTFTTSAETSLESGTRETSPKSSEEVIEKDVSEGPAEAENDVSESPAEAEKDAEDTKKVDEDDEATPVQKSKYIMPFSLFGLTEKSTPKPMSAKKYGKTVPEDFDDDIPLKPEIVKEMKEMATAAEILNKMMEGNNTPTLLTKPINYTLDSSHREFKSTFPFLPQMKGPTTRKEEAAEKKKFSRTREELKLIMRSQKMYVNRDKVSDFHPEWTHFADDLFRFNGQSHPFNKPFHFSSSHELEKASSGMFYQVARGDGNAREAFSGKDHIRFCLLLSQPHGSFHNWESEMFEPLFIYPDLFNMDNSPVSSTVANILPYTLHLMPESYLRDQARIRSSDLYTVDSSSSLTMRELFAWRPNRTLKLGWTRPLRFGQAVMRFVGRGYVNPFHVSTSLSHAKGKSNTSKHPLTALCGAHHLHISSVINEEVAKFVDIVALAYIEAFMLLTGYKTIGIHSTERAYVYAYEFFIGQRVPDLGWALLKFLKISPYDLDSKRFPPHVPYNDELESEFPDSLQLMLDSLDKNGTLNDYTKRTIILAICILKSPFVFKFILRALLFFVDARSANTLQEYTERKRHHAEEVQLKALSRHQKGKYDTIRECGTNQLMFRKFPGATTNGFRSSDEQERDKREKQFIGEIIRIVRDSIIRENSAADTTN